MKIGNQAFELNITASGKTVVCYRGDVYSVNENSKTADIAPLYLTLQSGATIKSNVTSDDKDKTLAITTTGNVTASGNTKTTGTVTINGSAPVLENYSVDGSKYANLAEAIAKVTNGQTIEVLSNVYESTFNMTSVDKVVIDLNGYQLNVKTISVPANKSLSILNGTLTADNGLFEDEKQYNGYTSSCIDVDENATIILNDVDYIAVNGCALYPAGNASKVDVIDSSVTTLNGAYGVATNNQHSGNVIITITGSTITTHTCEKYKYDNTAVMINVAGTLNISDSTLVADRQCLFVRAGTATVSDTTFVYNGGYNEGEGMNNRDTGKWGTGNDVSSAAIVVGNLTSTAYTADAKLTLTGCTITNNANNGKDLVIAQDGNNGKTASVTIKDMKSALTIIEKTGFESNEKTTSGVTSGTYTLSKPA